MNRLSIIRDQLGNDDNPRPSMTPVIGADELPEAPAPPVVDPNATLVEVLRELRDLREGLIGKPGTNRVLVGQQTTTSATYVNVLTWTIPPDRVGQLGEISIRSDTPPTAQFRVTIAGVVQFQDALITQPLTSVLPSNNLLEGDQTVEIDVLSDGAISIVADATISGIEREP